VKMASKKALLLVKKVLFFLCIFAVYMLFEIIGWYMATTGK